MSLPWKVHGATGRQLASCAYAEDAAAVVAVHCDGATIKFGGRVVFKQGRDGNAGDSYDGAASIARDTASRHAKER
jgi:hypothetical protein